jgi:hypothetical protein
MLGSSTICAARDSATERTRIYAVLALLGLSGVFVVLLCTARYGAGTSPDSSAYVSSARSLLSGRGYRLVDGSPYAVFPPLFPTLIALGTVPAGDALTAARFLNALAFGGIVFLSGWLFLMGTASRAFAVVGALSVALCGELLDVSCMVWSEPIFVLLTLLFIVLVARFLNTRDTATLLLAALAGGLAWLQRYAGMPIILAGCLLVGLGTRGAPVRQRLRSVVYFGLVSAGPMAVWFFHNLLRTGRIGAPRYHISSARPLSEVVVAPLNVMAEWFVPGSGLLSNPEQIHWHQTYLLKWFGPGSESSPLRVLGMAVVVLLAVVAAASTLRRRTGSNTTAVAPVWAAAVFTLAYLGFLVVYSRGVPGDTFTHRYLVPAYAPLAFLATVGMKRAFGFLGGRRAGSERVKSLGLLLCVLWLLYPLDKARSHFRYCHHHGMGGYSTPEWEQSPLMEWLRNHPLQGRLYSNAPDIVGLLTGIEAASTPEYWRNPSEFARRKFVSQPSYIAWFYNTRRHFLYDLRELLCRYRMQEVAVFPEGRLYQYLGESGPAASGVYRFWSGRAARHFYTIRKAERNRLMNQRKGAWAYEGAAFYAFRPDDPRPQNVRPVYRLRAAGSETWFYTIDEAEKDRVISESPGVWTCEGIAFYAWPQADEKDVKPIYRFWSERLGSYLYTGSEDEKAGLSTDRSGAWTYQGIAWYAYGPA